MLMREKIPGSPRFSVLQATESWAGPGYEANLDPYVTEIEYYSVAYSVAYFKHIADFDVL